jgi:hypothetical protein
MITGVVRTVRWERELDAPNLITLSIAEPRPSDDSLVESIFQAFEHQYIKGIDDAKKNTEYMLKEGQVLTSRLIDAFGINEFIHSNFADTAPQMKPLVKAGRPIMLDMSSPGSLSALHFATDPSWYRPLGSTGSRSGNSSSRS